MSPEQRFANAYEAYYWAVVRYFARRAGHDRAQDLAGEVFTTAWRRRRDVPEDALAWLYATASNVLRNERRRAGRHSQLLRRLSLALPDPDDESDYGQGVDHAWVRAAMGRLSQSDREVLRLSAWEELSVDQVARVLSTSRSAAAMRLHRARERLRRHLESEPTPRQVLRRSR